MDCEDFREALSARLDDEEGAADHPTDAHLDHCTDCRYWYDAAALITRRTRTSAVVAWPDVSDAVLARVPPRVERPFLVRVALGAVGVLQCGTGLATLAGTAYETGAWQVALGVALVTAAARRLSVTTLLPLLGTLVALLALGEVAGGTNPAGIASLVLATAGLALAVVLGRTPPQDRGPSPSKPAANRLRLPGEPEDNRDSASVVIHETRTAKSA
ncbi:hypothetical protein [Actinophytocola oryzae]|uniref:Putative anti-sigma-YlaC factor YlaD n=1 Tax=Actinophytocola oryzae TaxID=502181 RepID=A0A4R7VUT6_9PSEU|nr:hypothetical protein [Actinophytocola oryzae]TDV53614.1 putative anti-sigma-YlaC factor YlaD [Actinophytocola oryzae]